MAFVPTYCNGLTVYSFKNKYVPRHLALTFNINKVSGAHSVLETKTEVGHSVNQVIPGWSKTLTTSFGIATGV